MRLVTERMSSQLYHEDADFFLYRVKDFCSKARIVEYFEDYKSFNSINIIASKDLDTNSLIKDIEDEDILESGFSSGNVFYFIYRGCFKVNIHLIDIDYIDTHVLFMSYAPLGVLLKIHAGSMNLGYGHKGLRFIRPETHISHNIHESLKILGFTDIPKRFSRVEDVYHFMTTSKFFSKSAFNYSNIKLNNIVKAADTRAYNNFLGFIKNLDVTSIEYKMSVDETIEYIKRFKPDITDKILIDLENLTKEEYICCRYSTAFVSSVIEEPELDTKTFASELRSKLRLMDLNSIKQLHQLSFIKESREMYTQEIA